MTSVPKQLHVVSLSMSFIDQSEANALLSILQDFIQDHEVTTNAVYRTIITTPKPVAGQKVSQSERDVIDLHLTGGQIAPADPAPIVDDRERSLPADPTPIAADRADLFHDAPIPPTKRAIARERKIRKINAAPPVEM